MVDVKYEAPQGEPAPAEEDGILGAMRDYLIATQGNRRTQSLDEPAPTQDERGPEMFAVRYLSHWDGEGDEVYVLAWKHEGEMVTHEGGVKISDLLEYEGDKVLNVWPLHTRPAQQQPVGWPQFVERAAQILGAEQERLSAEDYLMDSDDCIKVLRETVAALSAQGGAGDE
ncbi:hypothetical protein DN820_01895 [Stutzerimonas nosocomialis]|uniref:Uncharacterized protein n=1 Tax=Stutzerimonas nosocomialis TaxID=1056496 RepID=A0A5R9QJ00_9GAMM|nr:hypothetical protein [Stutzerimonas nosocomialis]TLX65090.1 hypothetical protein DN820_01895 [Stutzerimonas nosocomialis]